MKKELNGVLLVSVVKNLNPTKPFIAKGVPKGTEYRDTREEVLSLLSLNIPYPLDRSVALSDNQYAVLQMLDSENGPAIFAMLKAQKGNKNV